MTFKISTLKYFTVLSLIFISLSGVAQNRVLIDGQFDEWAIQSTIYTDASGDGGSSGIDFGKVQVSNDQDFVFFYVEVGTTINLQDVNDVAIYVDIDDNPNTGSSINGIGAELTYSFGDRSGSFSGSNIGHDNIGIITAPTVTSDRFEIAIKRSFTINGSAKSMSNHIKVVFKDNSSNGDVAPSTGGLEYTFSESQLEPLPSYSFQKPAISDMRIMSYNAERDGFFNSSREASYDRILKAVQPDIIGFQEIYDNTSKQVADQVESMLPSGTGEQWYYAGAEPDCHAISRYPITKSASIAGVSGSGNAAFLIDIPDSETDMLLIVAHPPCCSNNSGRQLEVDKIMQFVREAKNGKGPIPIEDGAPIIILGDMNFVGEGGQLQTLLTGDISDEATHGADFTPDWDGSNLIDSKPYATGVPFNYSWYSESSAFSPGRLDYILYSGSNLELNNTYSLFTPGLSQDSLTAYNIQASDALIASDHLPLISDFTLKNKAVSSIQTMDANRIDLKVNPNPAYGVANLSFTNPTNDMVSILLIDQNGREIDVLHNGNLSSGKQKIVFNASTYPSGTYFLKVSTSEAVYYKRVSLVR
jgi:endonuclease/exonuclease/phosphatase family metal-dependent hydrolase